MLTFWAHWALLRAGAANSGAPPGAAEGSDATRRGRHRSGAAEAPEVSPPPRSHVRHGKLARACVLSNPQLSGAGRKNCGTHGGSQRDMHIDCASPSSARRPADRARRASSPTADASCHPQPVAQRAPRRLCSPKGRAPLTPCPMALDWWGVHDKNVGLAFPEARDKTLESVFPSTLTGQALTSSAPHWGP